MFLGRFWEQFPNFTRKIKVVLVIAEMHPPSKYEGLRDTGNNVLLQNATYIILKCSTVLSQNALNVYYKMWQLFYHKMWQFITTFNSYYKMRQYNDHHSKWERFLAKQCFKWTSYHYEQISNQWLKTLINCNNQMSRNLTFLMKLL